LLYGNSISPWNGGITFKNVTIEGRDLCGTDFAKNEFVTNIIFPCDKTYSLVTNADALKGSVTVNPINTLYVENSTVVLTPVAQLGYEFSGWSGDASGTNNPLSLIMNSNKIITANFSLVGTRDLTTSAVNGTISADPAGPSYSQNAVVTLTAKPAIGYKFSNWSGDLTGTEIIKPITMDTHKDVTANFVRTNNFAINCAGDQYIAADGTVYAQNTIPATGITTKIDPIVGTSDPILYQSMRSGTSNNLNIPIDNGDYTVTLKFAEIFFSAAAKRSFNVLLEGNEVITNLDVFAASGGKFKAYDRTFNVTVTDGELNIGFVAVVNNPICNAIKVTNTRLSVDQKVFNKPFKIYPNPTTDKLYIDFTNQEIKKIQLIDSTAKVVYSNIEVGQKETIDLTTYSSGLYIVKIQTIDAIYTEKIIKK
jgi:hypothetical protein